jgi:hypothetical protein
MDRDVAPGGDFNADLDDDPYRSQISMDAMRRNV